MEHMSSRCTALGSLSSLPSTVSVFQLLRQSHVAQADLIQQCSSSFYFYLSSPGIIGQYHHAWLYFGVFIQGLFILELLCGLGFSFLRECWNYKLQVWATTLSMIRYFYNSLGLGMLYAILRFLSLHCRLRWAILSSNMFLFWNSLDFKLCILGFIIGSSFPWSPGFLTMCRSLLQDARFLSTVESGRTRIKMKN